MGEFAWSTFEKEEGKFDFSFLLNATHAAAKYGINVILGTPTADPSKWLIDKHPEVLVVIEDGKTLHHGSRQQHNHTNGFAKGKTAVSKNGNIFYLGFYSFSDCDIYYDIISKHLNIYTPQYTDFEVLPLGEDYKIYLNYGKSAILLCVYDLISERNIEEIEPVGVVITRGN